VTTVSAACAVSNGGFSEFGECTRLHSWLNERKYVVFVGCNDSLLDTTCHTVLVT